jgi:hypothetical protein
MKLTTWNCARGFEKKKDMFFSIGSVANFWFGRIDPEVFRFRDFKPAGG